MNWVFDLLRTMVMSRKNLHDTPQRFDLVSHARPTMAYIPGGSLSFVQEAFFSTLPCISIVPSTLRSSLQDSICFPKLIS
jgi:hypothetical protein